jgi:hypothetical protein
MNIQLFNDGENLGSIRSKINSNFTNLANVVSGVCEDGQNDNPIRVCLESDFSDPCDSGNLSNPLLLNISTQLGSSLSSPCPSSSNAPSCSALAPLHDGVSAMLSNISNQIGSALSSQCPSTATPSCDIYQPIYNGSSTLVSNIVNNISLSITNPCSASAPSCADYAPLQAAQLTFTNNLIQTIFSSFNSTISASPCTLFNSQDVTLSGPLAPCVDGNISSSIGTGLKTIIEQSVETVISTIGNSLQNPCTFLNSQTIQLSGPLSSCLSNAAMPSEIGDGVKAIVQDGIQTIFSTINTVLTGNTCALLNTASYTLSGPLSNCGVSIPSLQSNVGNLLNNVIGDVLNTVNQTVANVLSATPQQILSGHVFPMSGPLASCFSGNIPFGNAFKDLVRDTLQTAIDTLVGLLKDPCAPLALIGPMAQQLNINLPNIDNVLQDLLSSTCALEAVEDFISTNQETIIPAALMTPMPQEAEDSIKSLVEYLRCDLFEKFIDTDGNAGDICIKDSILEFVKNNTCDVLEKINEGSNPYLGYTNSCQSELNIFVDSLLCGYLGHLTATPLFNATGNGSGSFSGGTSPMYCTLNAANDIIEDYSPLFFVVINGAVRQMKIPTQMKIDLQNATITPQYYGVNGNKI